MIPVKSRSSPRLGAEPLLAADFFAAGALGRGRGIGRGDFAYEAVTVELCDQRLECAVESLADLLCHLAQRGAPVDRGKHCAFGALEQAGLARGFLDSLPRL